MADAKNEISDVKFYLAIIVLLVIAYFPSFTGDFVGDDFGRIVNLKKGLTLLEMLNGGLGDRPTLLTSVWLDRYVFGFSAGLMRLETLLIFGFMAVVMRRLVDHLSQRLQIEVSPLWRDGIIALYCIHPLHTQALTHVIQRGIILSSLGGFVATLLLLKANFDWRKFGWKLALLIWVLALLSKPNIAFLPIFWLILALYLNVDKLKIVSLSAFFLMLLLPVINYTVGGFSIQEDGHVATPFNYFLIQGKVLFIYAKLIILPIGLRFNHDILPPMIAEWWPGGLLWALYLSSLFLILRFLRKKIVGIFFAGALFAFLPESSFFPIMHAIFEHRTLFPMAFMAIGAVFLVGSFSFKKWMFGVFITLTILSVGLSYHRNTQTQRFSSWAEIELSHTCSIDFFQLYLVSRLLTENHFQEARRGLDSISRCSTPNKTVPCLEALYSFYIAPTLNKEGLNILKQCVHSDLNWEKPSRLGINSLVVKKIDKVISPELKACYAEDFFSTQLRYFKKFRGKFVEEINFYAMSADKCLATLAKDTSAEATFQKLKIRTIKRHHFGIPDDTLASDLAKSPQAPDYDYLRTLLETAPTL